MVAVITSVLVGATVGMLVAVISDHSLAATLTVGGVIAAGTTSALRRRARAWNTRLNLMEELAPYA